MSSCVPLHAMASLDLDHKALGQGASGFASVSVTTIPQSAREISAACFIAYSALMPL
ncbi:hypothetical protein V1282_003984 [Nitrobacteraceae bacterium AZCC 2146]